MPRFLLPLALSVLAAAAAAGEKIREYWPDGTLKAEYVVDAQGRRAGLSREWHENGQPKSKVVFKADAMDGAYESWHANGASDLACRYRKGVLHGPWERRREDGSVLESGQYGDGLREGDWTRFDEAGRPLETSRWRAGALDGVRRVYRGGELLSEQEYRAGLLVGLFGSRNLYAAPLAEVRGTLAGLMGAPELQRLDLEARESGDPARRLRADRALALARLRGLRFLAGVPWRDLTLDEDACDRAAAAAELCEALGKVDFAPVNPGWDDARFERARDALLRCNGSQGWGLIRSIDAWVGPDDRALFPKLTARRLALEPRMQKIGLGQRGEFSAMWTGDSSGPPWKDEASFFPAAGWMPVEWFVPGTAWSVRLNPSRFRMPDAREVRVSVRALDEEFVLHGEPFPLQGLHADRDMLIFEPQVTALPGFLYWVEVEGLARPDGTPARLAWLVHFVSQRAEEPAADAGADAAGG